MSPSYSFRFWKVVLILFLLLYIGVMGLAFIPVRVLTLHENVVRIRQPIGGVLEYGFTRTKHMDIPATVTRQLECKVPNNGPVWIFLEGGMSNVSVGLKQESWGMVEIPNIIPPGYECTFHWTAKYEPHPLRSEVYHLKSRPFVIKEKK